MKYFSIFGIIFQIFLVAPWSAAQLRLRVETLNSIVEIHWNSEFWLKIENGIEKLHYFSDFFERKCIYVCLFYPFAEIARIQSGGKPPGRDSKFVDIYHEKPIRLTVRALVPVKEHPKVKVLNWPLVPDIQSLCQDWDIQNHKSCRWCTNLNPRQLLLQETFDLMLLVVRQNLKAWKVHSQIRADFDIFEILFRQKMHYFLRVIVLALQFNFVGKLLGPKGNSMKRLQEDTMTKMAVLGRGSMRNKQQVKNKDLPICYYKV